MLKVELHAHTSIDALDAITHSTRDLIGHAASLRYGALAVTPHDRYFDPSGKPLVGNGDIHLLRQLGTTYSLVDAPAEPDAICAAIKAGRVEVRMQPLSLLRAASHFAGMATVGLIGRTQRLFGSRSR